MIHIHPRKSNSFHVLDTSCVRARGITLKSKGLHTFLIQLPESFKVSVKGLVTMLNTPDGTGAQIGRDQILQCINELIGAGFVLRVMSKDKKGQFAGYEYHVFENPAQKDEYLTDKGLPADKTTRSFCEARPGKEFTLHATDNGKPVNGFPVNGLPVNGKPVTINILNKTKDLNSKEKEKEEAENLKTEVKEPPSLEASIQQAVEWSQSNIGTVQYWYNVAMVKEDTPRDFVARVGGFFSHHKTDKGINHQVNRDPLKFFTTAFLNYLIGSKSFNVQKSNQAPISRPKSKDSGVSESLIVK